MDGGSLMNQGIHYVDLLRWCMGPPAEITADSGFAGFMSLEPHLAQAGRLGGFSGPEGFHRAAEALKSLLNEASISWR
jgi:predicted dehydrogenase